ncbi:MAG TPA: hypothetical protein VMV77_03010 [Bacteroidales bacterium]|nr:hypothetical protein [Bacteroidales bacterium]
MIIDQIKENFHLAQEILDSFISDPQTWEKLEKAGALMVQILKSGNKIISCGNDGSLCDVEIRALYDGSTPTLFRKFTSK